MRVGAGADGQVGWVQLLRVTGTKRALERDRPMKFLDAHVALDAGLCSGEVLWRPKPFHTPRVPWRTTHAVLFRDLLRLSETELQTLQRDRVALHDFIAVREPSFSNVASISRQLEILATSISAPTSAVGGSRDHIGIPGKKWTQIEAFASAVPRRRLPAVDWCSGKGYLSHRLLAHQAATSSTCLEIDPALIEAGRRRAAKSALPLTFARADVLSPTPLPSGVGQHALHVALHACGGLHRQMIQQAVSAGAAQLAVAPCCYHKHPPGGDPSSRLQPLSTAASASRLSLTHAELRLAGAAGCAARRRDQRLRDREMSWRLAFSAWHRRYQNRVSVNSRRSFDDKVTDWSVASRLPSVPLPVLAQGSSAHASLDGFEAFCRWGATVGGASAPARVGLVDALEEWDEREAALCLRLGEAHAARIARLELVRHAYQRPLEQWLVLDACLFLEEHGYHVTLRRFCEESVSPRNLLVFGERQ